MTPAIDCVIEALCGVLNYDLHKRGEEWLRVTWLSNDLKTAYVQHNDGTAGVIEAELLLEDK